MVLWLLAFVWFGCGVAAFVTYLVRERMRHSVWLGLPILFIATVALGPVALYAVLTNDRTV